MQVTIHELLHFSGRKQKQGHIKPSLPQSPHTVLLWTIQRVFLICGDEGKHAWDDFSMHVDAISTVKLNSFFYYCNYTSPPFNPPSIPFRALAFKTFPFPLRILNDVLWRRVWREPILTFSRIAQLVWKNLHAGNWKVKYKLVHHKYLTVHHL